MRLPKNIISGTYTRPRLFLCAPDKEKICPLDVNNLRGIFKFNSFSEVSFDVDRTYNDLITGETHVNPYYDKIEAVRLVEIEDFGYFEIQGPDLTGDGIKESKSIIAYSSEYTLSQKYLSDFYINTGEVYSMEVINADGDNIVPVVLYNPNNPKLSLLHLALESVYGWTIGHVDESLKKLARSFEIDRMSVYDFLMNEVCAKFNCYIVFDTINNTINVYAESLTAKFIGDGSSRTFTISPAFADVGTVSIDGYKTTRWQYNATNGLLSLDDIPAAGAHVEVVDGALTEWETDVYISFENLSQEININYDADSIKTVLTVTYGENGDIRETNLGLPYLTDISYYYTVDWMGQDLYDAYTAYLQKTNMHQAQYTKNTQEMVNIAGYMDFEENRLALSYSIVQSVNEETMGTYYVRGGTAPNYHYTEVSLPAEYNANTVYYRMDTANLNEDKVSNILSVLKQYFNSEDTWETELNMLDADFAFMETYTLTYLANGLKNSVSDADKEKVIMNFFSEMWEQIGRTPLKLFYYEPYKKVQVVNIEAGWSTPDSVNYWYYYPVVLLLNSIDTAIAARTKKIDEYQKQYTAAQQSSATIQNDLLLINNFTEGQLVRLNAFLREDELHLDNIVETSQDSIADSFKTKQDAMESGRIELQKLSQPQLQFSMSMANIYALPEFEPIVHQFQLGKVVKVGLRRDYVKQSRLLQVDINFDDFSDFSCEFGELTSLRSQSDIHADLLSKAISAGKSVATNASYWTKGSDQANSIDLRLQEGLLNSIEALRAIDGTQHSYMDKYGLHLEAVNPDTGEISDKRVWMVNNQIVFTDDGFKTSKSVLGEFTVDDETYYGLLAQAVIAGLVEGSTIKGGTIQIGEYIDSDGKTRYAFEVHADGRVTMNGAGHTIDGYATSEDMQNIQSEVDTINDSKMYRVEITTEDPTVISTNTDTATMICKVYSWDTDITNTLDANLFTWKRISNDTEQDKIWNAMPEHQGVKFITIDADDVIANSSFTCEVNLPE